MANDWAITPLGAVLTERQEKPSAADLESGAIRIVSKIGFNDGKIQLRIGGDTKTGMILVRPGDLIVSGINAVKGAIAIYDDKAIAPIAATIHYASYIPNRERVDIRFLWWLLRSQVFREILLQNLPGGIKSELKPKRFLSVPVPLPSLAEQQRIVVCVDALAQRVEEARGLRRAAVEEAEAIIQVAVKNVFDNKLEDGWKLQPLNDAAEIARGKFAHRPRNEPRFYGGNIPFIQIGDISNAKGYIRSFTQTLNQEGLSISRMFPEGTVVIAITGATVGVTGILTFKSCFPDSIVGIIPKRERATSEFIYWALGYVKSAALAGMTQTTQPNINLGDVTRLTIPIPPLDDQRRIVAYLDGLQAKVDELRRLQTATQKELDAMMPSILAKAFAGEL